MRVVLLALILALLPLEAIALPGAAWASKKVVVRDYTSAEWQPLVRETVAEFNAMLPKRAPRLIYRAMPEVPCWRAKTTQRSITVCLIAAHANASGLTTYIQHRHQLSAVKMRLWSGEEQRALWKNAVCHEMMHALTGIPDGGVEPDGEHKETSCVWGLLDAPSASDAAYAKRVYKKYGGKERARRHR